MCLVTYVSRYIYRSAIGFPRQIGSALVAEKWLHVKDDPHLLLKLSGLHCMSFSALPCLQSACSEYWDMAGQGIAVVSKRKLLTIVSRVDWDSGPLLEVCTLPARYEPYQHNGYR